jgi:hypothetical protein
VDEVESPYPGLPLPLARFMHDAMQSGLLASVPTSMPEGVATFATGTLDSGPALSALATRHSIALTSTDRFTAEITLTGDLLGRVSLECPRVSVQTGVRALAAVAIEWDECLTDGRPVTGSAHAASVQALVCEIDERTQRDSPAGLAGLLAADRALARSGFPYRTYEQKSAGLELAEALWFEAVARLTDGPFASTPVWRPETALLAALLEPLCGDQPMLIPGRGTAASQARRGVAQAAVLVDEIELVAVARAEHRLASRQVSAFPASRAVTGPGLRGR